MRYVFDTNTLSSIFKFYYFDNFPSFWNKFDPMVNSKKIVSVREVRRELKERNLWDSIKTWANQYSGFFADPTNNELEFITQIYNVKHFQQNISQRNLYKGKPVADPFIVAKAKIDNAIVVTEEEFRENAVKIPNICKHFEIECVDLEGFLIKENWRF